MSHEALPPDLERVLVTQTRLIDGLQEATAAWPHLRSQNGMPLLHLIAKQNPAPLVEPSLKALGALPGRLNEAAAALDGSWHREIGEMGADNEAEFAGFCELCCCDIPIVMARAIIERLSDVGVELSTALCAEELSKVSTVMATFHDLRHTDWQRLKNRVAKELLRTAQRRKESKDAVGKAGNFTPLRTALQPLIETVEREWTAIQHVEQWRCANAEAIAADRRNELTKKRRAELDELARSRKIDPNAFRRKTDLVEALLTSGDDGPSALSLDAYRAWSRRRDEAARRLVRAGFTDLAGQLRNFQDDIDQYLGSYADLDECRFRMNDLKRWLDELLAENCEGETTGKLPEKAANRRSKADGPKTEDLDTIRRVVQAIGEDQPPKNVIGEMQRRALKMRRQTIYQCLRQLQQSGEYGGYEEK